MAVASGLPLWVRGERLRAAIRGWGHGGEFCFVLPSTPCRESMGIFFSADYRASRSVLPSNAEV